uniref:Uncharacterized protein n=1 Tax=Magallana gigas TaxID=29159 RepID=K1R1L0_MAGGI
MEEKRITLRPVLIVYLVSSASTDRVNLAYCFVKVCIDAILLQVGRRHINQGFLKQFKARANNQLKLLTIDGF